MAYEREDQVSGTQSPPLFIPAQPRATTIRMTVRQCCHLGREIIEIVGVRRATHFDRCRA